MQPSSLSPSLSLSLAATQGHELAKKTWDSSNSNANSVSSAEERQKQAQILLRHQQEKEKQQQLVRHILMTTTVCHKKNENENENEMEADQQINATNHQLSLLRSIKKKAVNSATCHVCGKQASITQRVYAGSRLFHRDCMRCQTCGVYVSEHEHEQLNDGQHVTTTPNGEQNHSLFFCLYQMALFFKDNIKTITKKNKFSPKKQKKFHQK